MDGGVHFYISPGYSTMLGQTENSLIAQRELVPPRRGRLCRSFVRAASGIELRASSSWRAAAYTVVDDQAVRLGRRREGRKHLGRGSRPSGRSSVSRYVPVGA